MKALRKAERAQRVLRPAHGSLILFPAGQLRDERERLPRQEKLRAGVQVKVQEPVSGPLPQQQQKAVPFLIKKPGVDLALVVCRG